MLLSTEQVIACMRGSLDPNVSDVGIEPRRFTEHQLATYPTVASQESRMRSPAGISLDFYSNTDALSFTYTLTFESCRDWIGFDCYVNGNLIDRFFEEPIVNQTGNITFNFRDNCEKHITVYFPISVPLAIKDVQLSDNATFTAVPAKEKKVLWFGDSISQGMDARLGSLCLPVLLSKAWQCDILSQTMGGGIFDENFIDENLPYQPMAIITAFGCNDWYARAESNEKITETARAFAEKLDRIYPDVPKYFISPIWSYTCENRSREGMCRYKEVHDYIERGISHLNNIVLLRGYDLCGHDRIFLADGIHPNEIGFQYYADKIAKAISL